MSVFSFEQEQQFFHEIKQMLDQQTFERLILSQYKGELTQLEKITFRVVELHGKKQLSALYHHTTQDVTKNSLYTTNFTEPLSYQDSAFLKLPKFP
ncbi:hypothetical protein APD03_11030 [Acinetobacter baumannii]|nr:hypothetical protein APD03_11030 [Acinetobacter baumannii]KQD70224.1 hypothetical protein APD23_04255 [Acinetobacter baumannii]